MIFNMVGKSGPSLLITDTTDANGGIIRTITGKVVKLQTKSITPTTSVQTVNPDSGYDGFSQVTVGAAAGGGINNQNKTVSPTTSQQSITYDSGYTGLGTVTVNAMPSGTTTSPTSISGSSASVTTGTNTITLSKTISVTPQVTTAGYVSAGTAGNSSVSLTASVTTKAAATITPGTSNQTIASGTYLTGTQTISGDTNLVAGNIKSGVSIFGVSGTYEGSGGGGGSVTQDQDGYIVLPSTGGGSPSATQHVIHLEFTDSTDTDINVYYDDSLISTMITAYTPETYGQKTVTLAQLDGVTWYEPTPIPLNTQLIDYAAVVSGYIVDASDGQESVNEWSCCSDFTEIDPSMTFSFVAYQWYDMAFYDSTKTFISGVQQNTYADTIESDYAHGTLSGARIPSNAAYVRFSSYPNVGISSTQLSFIRTA